MSVGRVGAANEREAWEELTVAIAPEIAEPRE
jgi:hypothetical protein